MADFTTDPALRPDTPPLPEHLGRNRPQRASLAPAPERDHAAELEQTLKAQMAQSLPPAPQLPSAAYRPSPLPNATEASKMNVQWTGRTLRVDCVCTSDVDVQQLMIALKNFEGLLPKASTE